MTRNTIAEYRARKFKRSIAGQIFRGTFFALAYGPAIGAWKVAKAAYYTAKSIVIAASVIAMWALGYRDNITPQLVLAVGLAASMTQATA